MGLVFFSITQLCPGQSPFWFGMMLLAIICDLFSIQSRKLRSNNIWFEFKQVRARSEGLSVSGTLCRFGPYQHQNHLPYLQNGANLLAGRNVMSISTCIIQGPLLGFRPNVCPANTVIYVTFFLFKSIHIFTYINLF